MLFHCGVKYRKTLQGNKMKRFTLIATVGILFLNVLVESKTHKATVDLKHGKVIGKLEFTQEDDGPVQIKGKLTGLTPGKHGFHVHKSEIKEGNCTSAEGHFNPHEKEHGSPMDEERHVGDLGNIEAGADGVADVKYTDDKKLLKLTGDKKINIDGRGFVVHEKEDDLGKGGDAGSKKTGNAGGRFSCGTIKVAADSAGSPLINSQLSSYSFLLSSSMTFALSKFLSSNN